MRNLPSPTSPLPRQPTAALEPADRGLFEGNRGGPGRSLAAFTRTPLPPPLAAGLRVACIPLQAMVDAAGLLDINLLSLDVEGGELTVLRTLDLRATNVQVGGPRLGSRR